MTWILSEIVVETHESSESLQKWPYVLVIRTMDGRKEFSSFAALYL